MSENENNTPATGTASKTQALIDAARKRGKNAERVEGERADTVSGEQAHDAERVDQMAENRAPVAETLVQSRAKTLDGNIDPMAMGDVKGDGRDAKDYDDGDPHKKLGITTAEHGLGRTSDGTDGEIDTAFGHRMSRRTQAELARGRDAIDGARVSRQRNPVGSTAVTDAVEDPDGVEGDKLAAEKAEGKSLDDMTKAELVEYGQKHGFELDGNKNRPELLADAKAINTGE